MSADLAPIWVKNNLGLVFGPLTQSVFENMLKTGAISAPYQVSKDGVVFRPPGTPTGPVPRVETNPGVVPAPGPDAGSASPSPASWPARSKQAVPPAGRLEEWSPFRLYFVIAAAEAGGELVIGDGPTAVAIGFKHGTPHTVSSKASGLSAFLVEQGVIQPDRLEAVLPALEKAQDEVQGLITTGLLKPNDAFNWIQQHATAVLQRGLQLAKGPFTYDPAAPLSSAGFPLGNRWQLLIGSARRLDLASLRQRLAAYEGQAPQLAGSTSELLLTAQETRLLAHLEGKRALGDLAASFSNEADAIYRLVFLLKELDRVTWAPPAVPWDSSSVKRTVSRKIPATPAPAEQPPKATAEQPPPPKVKPKPAPAAKPAPAPPAAGEGSAAKVSSPLPPPPVRADELRVLLAALQGKNNFDRLGVPRGSAMPPQLKPIYFDLAKRYHPDTLPSDAPLEVRKLREDVLALLNEAYRVLSNDAARAKYLQQLEMIESGAADMDLEAILKAEEEFRVATVLFKSRRYADALTKLEECIKLHGDEGEFYAWRGYTKFLTSTDRKAIYLEALADQQTAVRLSPKCAISHLFAGHMAKLLDDPAAAAKAYKKALEVDPKLVDAERELRLMEARAKKKT